MCIYQLPIINCCIRIPQYIYIGLYVGDWVKPGYIGSGNCMDMLRIALILYIISSSTCGYINYYITVIPFLLNVKPGCISLCNCGNVRNLSNAMFCFNSVYVNYCITVFKDVLVGFFKETETFIFALGLLALEHIICTFTNVK